jgi:hypothetical protein
MSQLVVERLLGRLMTDGEFRRGFYANPSATCVRESLDVTSRELEALLTLGQSRLQAFAKELDTRIVRAPLGGARYWSGWAGSVASSRERGHAAPQDVRPRMTRRVRRA